MPQSPSTREIVRLRVISVIFGLLSLVGAYDYLMTFSHNVDYFKYLGYGERQIAYFTNYPVHLTLLLTLGVWGTVIGSVLLFLRHRWAVQVFAVAFISQTLLNIITFLTRSRWEILGPKLGTQDTLVLIAIFGMLLYSCSLYRKKVIQ